MCIRDSLTESGKDFYKYSLDILRLMEKALIDTKSTPEGFTGNIDCGLMPTFTRSALPITLSRFLDENPKVEFKITEAYSGVLEEMVRSNKIEFAIIAMPPFLQYLFVKKAILSNINVLCEKPFTVNVKEAKKLFDLSIIHISEPTRRYAF